jgi:hypothetical protein
LFLPLFELLDVAVEPVCSFFDQILTLLSVILVLFFLLDRLLDMVLLFSELLKP